MKVCHATKWVAFSMSLRGQTAVGSSFQVGCAGIRLASTRPRPKYTIPDLSGRQRSVGAQGLAPLLSFGVRCFFRRRFRAGFIGDAHLGEAIAEGIAGQSEQARSLALVAAGPAQRFAN